jgi:hypothetical protein
MRIDLDLATFRPDATLADADDFTSFAVAATRVEHVYIPVAELERLAGDRAHDPEWRAGLERMLAYAQSKGWTRQDGAIRAHVEWH